MGTQRTRKRTRGRRVPPCSSQRGSMVVEVMIALTVATLGLLGLTTAMTAGARLQQRTADYGLASRTLRAVHERMITGDCDQRFAEYQATPTFEVDRVQVEVSFPEQLLIDTIGGPVPATWRYRDTDGDGQVDLDTSATERASLLPVSVVLTWHGGEMRSSFLVTER
jgi:hypothetical protein